MEVVKISSEFIKLGQLLKFATIISSGALAKMFLEENKVLVNGVEENRRGRKIYPGDIVETLNYKIKVEKE